MPLVQQKRGINRDVHWVLRSPDLLRLLKREQEIQVREQGVHLQRNLLMEQKEAALARHAPYAIARWQNEPCHQWHLRIQRAAYCSACASASLAFPANEAGVHPSSSAPLAVEAAPYDHLPILNWFQNEALRQLETNFVQFDVQTQALVRLQRKSTGSKK